MFELRFGETEGKILRESLRAGLQIWISSSTRPQGSKEESLRSTALKYRGDTLAAANAHGG
jgi:hypothetical protein